MKIFKNILQNHAMEEKIKKLEEENREIKQNTNYWFMKFMEEHPMWSGTVPYPDEFHKREM